MPSLSDPIASPPPRPPSLPERAPSAQWHGAAAPSRWPGATPSTVDVWSRKRRFVLLRRTEVEDCWKPWEERSIELFWFKLSEQKMVCNSVLLIESTLDRLQKHLETIHVKTPATTCKMCSTYWEATGQSASDSHRIKEVWIWQSLEILQFSSSICWRLFHSEDISETFWHVWVLSAQGNLSGPQRSFLLPALEDSFEEQCLTPAGFSVQNTNQWQWGCAGTWSKAYIALACQICQASSTNCRHNSHETTRVWARTELIKTISCACGPDQSVAKVSKKAQPTRHRHR